MVMTILIYITYFAIIVLDYQWFGTYVGYVIQYANCMLCLSINLLNNGIVPLEEIISYFSAIYFPCP